MLFEGRSGLGIQFLGYIIRNKGCQLFTGHIHSPEALYRKIRMVGHEPGLPMHDVVGTLFHIALSLRGSSVTGRLSHKGWPQHSRHVAESTRRMCLPLAVISASYSTSSRIAAVSKLGPTISRPKLCASTPRTAGSNDWPSTAAAI